jgi:hypothetical protein
MELSGARPENPPFPAAYFLMKTATAYQSERTATRVELLESARHLQEIVQQERDLIPFRYSTEERLPELDNLVTKGSGTATGLVIDGKDYSITAGTGECYLEGYVPTGDGRWRKGERIDVRDKKRIATDNMGVVKISRKKVPFTLPAELARLIDYLDRVNDRQVKIYSYDKGPVFKELLEAAAEGMGGDDAAMEMLLEWGEDGKKQLIDALTKKPYKKYRPIVVRFLLSMYPDEPTYKIVGDFIETLRDGAEKDEYRAVLAAFTAGRENLQ